MSRAPRRPARRAAILVAGVLVWTLLAMYPNPAVFLRNIARYRHLPLDPTIEKRMGWDLPKEPTSIEFFVDSLLVPTPDWLVYRVPWYVPTADEVAQATHGDCEAKTMLLASLLAGKNIPFQIRASFTHIWVDYKGRKERTGETRDVAYLAGQQGRLGLCWPSKVSVRDFAVVQRQQLWDPMPPTRKAIWLAGLAWVALATLLLGGAARQTDAIPGRELVSSWRAPLRSYASRACWNALLILALIALAPTILRREDAVEWQLADLHEMVALSILAGAFLAWLEVVRPRRSVTLDLGARRLTVFSRLGASGRARTIEAADIDHFELAASPGGLRPWTVSAALRTGQRVQLLRYSSEEPSRAALRRLGTDFVRPVVVRSDRREYWTAADEIPLNLHARAAARPPQPPPLRPADVFLVEEAVGDRWALGYPKGQAGGSRSLLLLVGLVAALAAMSTVLLAALPRSMLAQIVWTGAVMLLGMTTYGAMSLREEVLAALAGARVEIVDGMLSFRDSDGKVASVPAAEVESVEVARQGDVPVIAVVTPQRVLHVRLYLHARQLEWARSAIEAAVSRASP